jgi:ABC-type iron transport system FetAB ATPase subunit
MGYAVTGFRLITVGLSEYADRTWTVKEAERSRVAVEGALLPRGAGVDEWTSAATKAGLREQFTTWSAEAPMPCVVYWVGHGEYSDDEYWLALADSQPPLGIGQAFRGDDIYLFLRTQQRRRLLDDDDPWVLVVLDTCGSGAGAEKIWSSFKSPESASNLGVIGTTDDGAAFAGEFANTFTDILGEFDGNDTDGVPLKDLVRRLEDRLGENKVHYAFRPTARLPLRADDPPPLVAPVDIHAELRRLLSRAGDVGTHFYAKAQGAEIGELAWYFTGREQERRTVARWLENAKRGLFVVTGPAGSGKSALLGMLVASSDKDLMRALVKEGYEVGTVDLRPEGVSFDLALLLSGRSFADSAAAFAAGLGLESSNDPDRLVDQVARKAQTDGRLTIVVDALDESRDPYKIASGLLLRLALLPGVRVLVGTRQSLQEDPDTPASADHTVLNALDTKNDQLIWLAADPAAVATYVERRLTVTPPIASAASIRTIAQEIARHNQPFLFARLAVHEIRAHPALAQSPAALNDLLGSGHRGIFAYAVRRYKQKAPKTEALLHALAYARGNGFPRTYGIWAAAARGIYGAPISDTAVAQALKDAAPYVMKDTESGQSVYRLAHRTFAEYYVKTGLADDD